MEDFIYRGKGKNQKKKYGGAEVFYFKADNTCCDDLCTDIHYIRRKDFTE